MNLSTSMLFSLLLAGGLLWTGETAADDQRPQNVLDEVWQVIFIQGQRVGYANSLSWETGEGDDKRFWSESLTQMTVARFGAQLSMTVKQRTEEDAAGNLKSFRLEMDNPPASHTLVEGTVKGDELQIVTTAAGKTKKTSQKWESDVKSPVYQDRLLQQDPIREGDERTMRVFDPQFLQVGEVTFTGLAPAMTELLDGSRPTLDRTQIVHSLVPGLTLIAFSNAEGESLKSETNLLGMVTYTVSRDEAVKEIAGAQLDLALDTLVKVKRIPDAHDPRRITYDISIPPPRTMVPLPQSDRQSVERIDDQSVRVTLHPPNEVKPTATSQPVDEQYLQASRYLESDHPKVVAHANQAAANLKDPFEMAVAMEKYVHDRLAEKNFSTALATAAEVAVSMEGDCTEHAVLLAAMLRAKSIPSRVVVGVVYSEGHSAFVGHMWTEAYLNGHWMPLDATLGHGGIGAGHLKFADASLSDDGPPPVTAFVPLVGVVNQLIIEVVPE